MINFLNPLGLLAMLSLPLVAFLHLRREQSRRWIVSSLRLWDFLDEQMRGGKMRRLPFTILLILDLLIAFLFSLAFARPQISLPPIFPAPHHLIILLDTSASMTATDVQPTRYARSTQEIEALIETTDRRDVITVITFGGEAEVLGDTREISSTALLKNLATTEPVMQGVDIATGFTLANALSISDLSREVHIFSDAAYAEPETALLGDRPIWHIYGVDRHNQAILTLQPSGIEVFVELHNFSLRPVVRILQIYGDGVLLDETAVDIPAQQNYALVWPIYGEFSELQVRFANADVYPLDDTATAITQPQRAANVLLVADDPTPYDRALEAAGNVALTTSKMLTGQRYDLVVFVDQGEVDLPAGNVLIITSDQEFLYTQKVDPSGTHFSLSLESGFLRSAEFPLLIASVVEASRALALAPSYSLGDSYPFPPPEVLPSITITDPVGEMLTHPVQRKETVYQFSQPGLYQIALEDRDGIATTYPVVVNAGSMIESDVAPQFAVQNPTASSPEATEPIAIDVDLMPWLLFFALFFLWLEAIWAWR